jgi:hypothetical protein
VAVGVLVGVFDAVGLGEAVLVGVLVLVGISVSVGDGAGEVADTEQDARKMNKIRNKDRFKYFKSTLFWARVMRNFDTNPGLLHTPETSLLLLDLLVKFRPILFTQVPF